MTPSTTVKRQFSSDSVLASLGYTDHITKVLDEIGVDYRVFSDVQADPTLSTVKKGAELMKSYQPDDVPSSQNEKNGLDL